MADKEILEVRGTVQSMRKDRKGLKLNDQWYSDFDVLSCNTGDVVEIHYYVNGDFRNIKALKVVGQSASTASTPSNSMYSNDKTASMLVSYAKDLWAAGRIEKPDMHAVALGLVEVYTAVLKKLNGE